MLNYDKIERNMSFIFKFFDYILLEYSYPTLQILKLCQRN